MPNYLNPYKLETSINEIATEHVRTVLIWCQYDFVPVLGKQGRGLNLGS